MTNNLQQLVLDTLADTKAKDVINLDVRDLTDVTDTMIICSGTSKTHLRSMADKIVEKVKACGISPLGVEGIKTLEWILVDLGDLVIHIMLPEVREFYSLEKLWTTTQKLRANKN